MSGFLAHVGSAWLGLAAMAMAADPAASDPVRLDSGLVEGLVAQRNGIVSFKGIPYAAPPLGNLRWREPEPPSPWDGVLKATAFGPACVQTKSPGGKQPELMSEDCLYINVWTPAVGPQSRLPVLFYIHGGADSWGSGNSPDGESMASSGLVVVTMNFRLGILAGMGHPQLTAESSHRSCANYGMLDIIAALRWTRRNIAALGGDPDAITIAGQSSGAHSVHYLTTSPLARGLFRGAIAISFPCDFLMGEHRIPTTQRKEQRGLEFAAAKRADSISDLRKIPALELIAEDPLVDKATRSGLGGGVSLDGWAFPLEYHEAIDRGAVADVPILTGLTADDFGPPARYSKTTLASYPKIVPDIFASRKVDFLTMYPATNDQEARDQGKLAQIEHRMAGVFHWARRRAETNRSPAYTYFFEQVKPNPEHPEKGASHGSDLVYVFNNLRLENLPWTDGDRRFAEIASGYFSNFVKTGNPNGLGLPEWRAFDSTVPETMSLCEKPGPREIVGKERLWFFQHMYNRESVTPVPAP